MIGFDFLVVLNSMHLVHRVERPFCSILLPSLHYFALFLSLSLSLSVSLTCSSLCYQNIFACVRKIENMHTMSVSSMCQIERTILKSGLRAANEQRKLVHQKHFFLSVFHFFYFYYIRSFELFIIRTNIHCINKLFKLSPAPKNGRNR